MSARPTYSDEFKADAVNLVLSSGRSPASVAPELGISVTALKRWVQLHREGKAGAGGKPDEPGCRENTRRWRPCCVKSKGRTIS
jgi:transposase